MIGFDFLIASKTLDVVLAAGATRAKHINPSVIVVDERVLMKCKIPQCPDYGICPACPPFNMPPDEVRKIIKLYKSVLVLQVDTKLSEEQDYYKGANLLHEIILQGEKAAFMAGARFATGLIGGSCHKCKACRKGEKCPTPENVRPSLEAMGIDVFATTAAAGIPIKFPVIDKVIWTGLILLN